MNATKEQLVAIHTALHQKNLLHRKTEIVEAITNGRTSSSRELQFDEAKLLLIDLNKNRLEPEQGKKMRNNIVAMAHEMGWITTVTTVASDGKIKQQYDYSRLDNWMLKHSYLHKKLFSYTYVELPKLVTQFKNVYASYLKK